MRDLFVRFPVFYGWTKLRVHSSFVFGGKKFLVIGFQRTSVSLLSGDLFVGDPFCNSSNKVSLSMENII